MSNSLETITADSVQLRQAIPDDVPSLVALMDRCYRGTDGWTNEGHLIGGIRTTPDEMQKLIADDNIYLFVFENPTQVGELLGCISIDFTEQNGKPSAYIGTFAVVPELQGKGVGNVMLSAVESFAQRHAKAKGITHLSMSILSHRPELLAYYQRRGYVLTGEKLPFPVDGNNGEPKRDDLWLESLQKPIQEI